MWTVCRHPNGWDEQELSRFERDVNAKDLLFLARRRAKSAALSPLRLLTSQSRS